MNADRTIVVCCPEESSIVTTGDAVVQAIEDVVTGVEVLRPGRYAIRASGPVRYFGGESAVVERLVEHVAAQCGMHAVVGIADGVFAAELAARAGGRIVPTSETKAFLSEIPVSALERPALVGLLRRLGVRTLGDYAALPARAVLTRFGPEAADLHRLAAGDASRSAVPRERPPELEVFQDFDEPIRRIDVAAFAAHALARQLNDRLTSYGLSCAHLGIEARTSTGETLLRTWRNDGPITPTALADRVRWQLEGWLTDPSRLTEDASIEGITRLRLTPESVMSQLDGQPGLWGEPGEERDRAIRALTRVQGILGPEAVTVAVCRGGRGQVDQIEFVPFGQTKGQISSGRTMRKPSRRGTVQQQKGRAPGPWPGRLPPPLPATVYHQPIPATVCDSRGVSVGVTGRLGVTGSPTTVAVRDAGPVVVTGWAGPWPVDERWWSGELRSGRYARFQVLLRDSRAMLLHLADGRWAVAALYD